MRPYQRFSLVVIFKSFENVPKLYFSLQQKIATFKPEDDIINIETGRNDNKKTVIIFFLPWGLRPHTPAGGKPPDPQN